MQADVTIKPGMGGANRPPIAPQRSDVTPPQNTAKPDATPSASATEPATREELEQAISEIASAVQNAQRNLNFSVDESSGRTIVKVIDSQTDEVIRQIPSEEALALARRMRESDNEALSGLLMQSRA